MDKTCRLETRGSPKVDDPLNRGQLLQPGSHIKQPFLTFLSFRINCCLKMFPRWTAFFLFFKLLSVGESVPVEATSVNPVMEILDCNNENSEIFDQRQNGTENYRIHVNGVVVLVAPAETVLQAAQLGNLQPGTESETATSQTLKPKPKPPTASNGVPNENSVRESAIIRAKDSKNQNNLKLLNLLHMFRSIRHDSEENHHHGNN